MSDWEPGDRVRFKDRATGAVRDGDVKVIWKLEGEVALLSIDFATAVDYHPARDARWVKYCERIGVQS